MDTTSDTPIKHTIRVFHIVSPFSSTYVMVNTIDKPFNYFPSIVYSNIALLIAKFVPMNEAIDDFPSALVNLIDFDNKTAKYVRKDDGYKRNTRPNKVYSKEILGQIVKMVHLHTHKDEDAIRDKYKSIVDKGVFDTCIVKDNVPYLHTNVYNTLYDLAILYPFCTINDATEEYASGEINEVFPELCTPKEVIKKLQHFNIESMKMSKDAPTTIVAKSI